MAIAVNEDGFRQVLSDIAEEMKQQKYSMNLEALEKKRKQIVTILFQIIMVYNLGRYIIYQPVKKFL